MMDNDIGAYLIQETWLPGDWETDIRGYLIIHHNHGIEKGKEGKSEPKKTKKRGREKRGVAIILSPSFRQAYRHAGNPKPIVSDPKGQYSGRFIGITLCFPNFDSHGKKVKGLISVF